MSDCGEGHECSIVGRTAEEKPIVDLCLQSCLDEQNVKKSFQQQWIMDKRTRSLWRARL